ncbi:efflux RND transporter periplasmic adaptor subunit [Sphingomonas jatrophae]|uniref:RND family efflux transporter, MFP subunit n=1 Tax=Sphingomonas jatrophae TaxID=1166337 RepID=A0A1I6JUR1_9SPHN|nr:efflux RND transporter periplasmic adaptor subunit [Sphingomonas jatrophae]SFR82270.1 RND family efflux transporter, MFP subunit [Sphingomonas jatrophae]
MPEPATHDTLPPDDEADRRELRGLKRIGLGVGIAALAIAGWGIASRYSNDRHLAGEAAQAGTMTVAYVLPETAGAHSDLVLPGAIQAYNSAAIYARTNGYLRRWLADIGDHVRAGQPLAILDAPDLDQQLAQARADYQTTLAQQALAGTTSKRWANLLKADAVSQQEADERAADYRARTAVANASLANVRRLEALKGFTQLRAPFAGIVTSRSAQIGALVVSGTSAAQPLFTVSDAHRVRIYVRVPQGYSGQIHKGMHAALTLPEYPGRAFDAVLTRSAGAVDNASGAMLVELQTGNGDGALKPGAFAQVSFPLAAQAGTLRIPSSALMFGGDGTSVATVDAGGRVTIKRVTIARDLGRQIEVGSGLTPRDRVIDMPPDAVQTGDRVQAAPAPKDDTAQPKAGNGKA